MRLWVHLIWRNSNTTVLAVAGSRENAKLEELINSWHEEIVAYAWYLYVNADPRPYNLEPVKHVDKFTSPKTGKTYMNTFEDTASITRFPLSAFLATAEGYLIEARIRLTQKNNYRGELDSVVEALKGEIAGLQKKWALVDDEVTHG